MAWRPHCVVTTLSVRSRYVNEVLTTSPPRLYYDLSTSTPRYTGPRQVVTTLYRFSLRQCHVRSTLPLRLYQVLRFGINIGYDFPNIFTQIIKNRLHDTSTIYFMQVQQSLLSYWLRLDF